MPKIIPIKDLKDTAKVSLMVRENAAPVYITKNGYDDMVIMTMREYDEMVATIDLMGKLWEGERSYWEEGGTDAFEDIAELRRKYGL